ncbi:vitamin B12 ABC transporter substrate-binding protein BtuF [Veronia pacifica]|uniref:Cobalamin-binding protein n=1 Tax=Veronia pacifica TaxID=1080227 RepID=A0A1C3EGQ6_9GAMM|nr:vitamin B12 ABC transporter substrate-binding protein BtuF [Veronia pacifica]ODA32446.1 cobalamin-binding protein [Veronia pacifica]
MKRFLLITLLSLPTLAHAASFKVISLAPHATELAYAAGLGDALIAVDDYSDYPPEVDKLEHVASYRGINLERVVALKPDLVIAWKGGNPDKEVAKLEKLGIKVFYSNPKSLDETAQQIDALSKFAADPAKGSAVAEQVRSELAEIRAEQKGKTAVPYFYQLASDPLMTNGGNNWPAPLFKMCGGENVFKDAKAAYPMINKEQVIVNKPEAIFYSDNTDPKAFWESWKSHLPAAQSDSVFSLNPDWLNRATPRALKAVRQICTALDKVRATA